MNEENFKKGLKELKNIRMTEAERKIVLEKVFSSPVESPYMDRIPVFAVVTSHHTRMILTGCLVATLTFSGVVYGSDRSLPGDLLYPIKTKVVEPVLDVVNYEPENKIIWEEEKVTRRIAEAEKLLEKDELDEEKLDKLEKSIEKSSVAFTKAADSVASSTGTSTLSRKKKAEDLKREFRGRISERQWQSSKQSSFSKQEESDDGEEKEASKAEDDSNLGVKVEVKDAEKVVNELHEDKSFVVEEVSSDDYEDNHISEEKIKRLTDTVIRVLDDNSDEDEDRDWHDR